MSTEVISIRVSKKLKKELEELGIDYAEKVRQYLEELVMMEKRKRALKEADEIRKRLKSSRPGWMDIREDRDAEDDDYH